MKMEDGEKKKIRLYKCFICPTRSSNGLFSFPKKTEIRQEWLAACHKTAARPIDKICHEHFHSSCFVPNIGSAKSHYRLYPDSIPTLKLPSAKEKVDSVTSDHSYATNRETMSQKVKALVVEMAWLSVSVESGNVARCTMAMASLMSPKNSGGRPRCCFR